MGPCALGNGGVSTPTVGSGGGWHWGREGERAGARARLFVLAASFVSGTGSSEMEVLGMGGVAVGDSSRDTTGGFGEEEEVEEDEDKEGTVYAIAAVESTRSHEYLFSTITQQTVNTEHIQYDTNTRNAALLKAWSAAEAVLLSGDSSR